MKNPPLLFRLVLCLLGATLSLARAEPFLDDSGSTMRVHMYRIEHPMPSPRPGQSIAGGPITYRLVAIPPEEYKGPPGRTARWLGGPYLSQEEVIADAARFELVSVAKKDAIPVFDANGNHLQKYTTFVPVVRGQAKPAPATGPAGAQAPPPDKGALPPAAHTRYKLVAVTGTVTVERLGEPTVTLKQENIGKFTFRIGDRIYTEQNSSFQLESPEGNVSVGEMAGVKLEPGNNNWGAKIHLDRGDVTMDISGPAEHGDFILYTPTASLKNEGTKFRTRYDPKDKGTRITVQEGNVVVQPQNSQLAPCKITAGKSATVFPDRIEPADACTPVDAGKMRGLSAESRTVPAGAQINLPISLHNVTTDAAAGLGNLNFEVTYDPSVVSVAGKVARGNIYGSGVLFEANATQSGLVRVGFAGERGVTQSGTVAQIPLKVVGQPGQQTELKLRIVQSQTPNGQSVALQTTHGRITIPGGGQTHATVASTGSTGPGSPPGSAAGGNTVPDRLRNPDGTAKGDSDHDQRLTARDAEAALQMSVGNRPVDNNLDVDKDGNVMSADARQILQEASGMVRR